MTMTLEGRRCRSCGLVSIPAEPFGCERCGFEDLQDIECESTGTVTALAVVQRHAGETPATPFTVVEVQLDAGPVVRTQLLESQQVHVSIGSRVAGTMLDERVVMAALQGEVE
jgi:uncharacterized OB-fold protein